MTVPSHNLYDFIHQVTEKQYWLVYFYPWGNKNLSHLIDHIGPEFHNLESSGLDPESIIARKFFPESLINRHLIRIFQPVLLCHDQEPLYFDLYNDYSENMQDLYNEKPKYDYPISDLNLRSRNPHSWQKKWVLLHSEKNSQELKKYENTGQYQGAFWWSHAVLARDWYRYAEHDLSLNQSASNKKLFLIYARDHSGSRAYRKTFLSLIDPIKNQCQIGSIDNASVDSSASASYNSLDFISTDISIVLETLFDERIHLTEKILRPIACGHPFILAGGPGSLEFVRSYGFETFSPWINESYDSVTDSDMRLVAIKNEMQRISSLSQQEKQSLLTHCRAIAERNKQRFFSKEFHNQVVSELVNNVSQARELDNYTCDFWLKTNRWRRVNRPEHFDKPSVKAVYPYLISMARHIRLNHGSLEQYQCHEHSLDNKSSANGNDVQ